MDHKGMSEATALYVISGDEDVLLMAPPEPDDLQYFLDHIVSSMKPMKDEEYMHGPAVILHSFARYSYILYRQDVYWCVEWDPGLIVVRFSSNRQLAWTALRSPSPNFGGREAAKEEIENYDDEAENYQYNLVFKAWDAQFDQSDREYRSFQPIDSKNAELYAAALTRGNELGEQLQAMYAGDDKYEQWSTLCKENLRTWAGEGIRVPNRS